MDSWEKQFRCGPKYGEGSKADSILFPVAFAAASVPDFYRHNPGLNRFGVAKFLAYDNATTSRRTPVSRYRINGRCLQSDPELDLSKICGDLSTAFAGHDRLEDDLFDSRIALHEQPDRPFHTRNLHTLS